MKNDFIIARQCEKIEELEEQVRQLKKLLVPVFITPIEWGLNRQEQALFRMLLKREIVTRAMFDAAIATTSNTPRYCDVILHNLRKKLKKFGFEIKNQAGIGWRLVDRKTWQKRLAEVEAAE